jgi:L-lactate dehydrogenase complex protein LldG
MKDMKASYEEAWDSLRAHAGADGLPRTVNFISGPSRTADIEQRLIMGAHGPKRLHVILVGDGA